MIDPSDAAHPIYARGLARGATLDPNTLDWTVPMFGMRFELAQFVTREAAVSGMRTGQPAQTGERALGMFMSSAPNVTMRLDRPGVAGAGGATSSGTPPPPPPPPVPAGGRTTNSSVSIYVQSARGSGDNVDFLKVAPRPRRPGDSFCNTRGSLDAAVERRRNLWLSFSILGILAAGVALIVVNAQHRNVWLRSDGLRGDGVAWLRATHGDSIRGAEPVGGRRARRIADAAWRSDRDEGRRLTEMVEQVLDYAGLSSNQQLPLARAIDPAISSGVVQSCGRS